MQIQTITDLNTAEKLWNQFVISDNWYNQWELRKLFHQTLNISTPLFYVAAKNNQPVGILPLQISNEEKKIEFFGGGFFEGNQAWAKDDQVKSLLYQSVKGNIAFDSIELKDKELDPRIEKGDEKFFLPIINYKNIDDYLQLFSSKRRSNLRRAFKKLAENKLTIESGTVDDLDILFQLNIKRFGEESVFTNPKRIEAFQEMTKLSNQWEIFTFKLNNKIEAVSLSTLYKDTYLYHNAGTNLSDYPNLGSLVIYHNIKKAIELGAKYFDAGSEDLGWKSRWHLQPIQLYKLLQ